MKFKVLGFTLRGSGRGQSQRGSPRLGRSTWQLAVPQITELLPWLGRNQHEAVPSTEYRRRLLVLNASVDRRASGEARTGA